MTETTTGESSSTGTPEWMAPELIRNEPFTEKCDIFSLGVIMWELCTLRAMGRCTTRKVVYAVANEGSRLEIPEGLLGRLIAEQMEAGELPYNGNVEEKGSNGKENDVGRKKEKDKKDKKKSKKKEKTKEDIVSEMRDSTIDCDTSDAEECEFWMPPKGERWDFDDGGDRWVSDSESGEQLEEDDAEGSWYRMGSGQSSLMGSSQVIRESSISVRPCVLIAALGPLQFGFACGHSSPTQDAITEDLGLSVAEMLEAFRNIKHVAMKENLYVLLVIAILLVTITFAATFTVPNFLHTLISRGAYAFKLF